MEGAGVKVTCLDILERESTYTRFKSSQPFYFFSSCLALNDLIRGRQADEIIDRLSEIWETLFRVLDDIKVRNRRLLYVVLFCNLQLFLFDRLCFLL